MEGGEDQGCLMSCYALIWEERRKTGWTVMMVFLPPSDSGTFGMMEVILVVRQDRHGQVGRCGVMCVAVVVVWRGEKDRTGRVTAFAPLAVPSPHTGCWHTRHVCCAHGCNVCSAFCACPSSCPASHGVTRGREMPPTWTPATILPCNSLILSCSPLPSPLFLSLLEALASSVVFTYSKSCSFLSFLIRTCLPLSPSPLRHPRQLHSSLPLLLPAPTTLSLVFPHVDQTFSGTSDSGWL